MEKFSKLFEGSYSYSSVQFNLSKYFSDKIAEFQKLIDNYISLEKESHITIKYGLTTNFLVDVKPVVENFGIVDVEFGKLNYFKEDDGTEVLYIEISPERSPGLMELNKLITDSLDCSGDTRDKYIPHCTIAYLPPGEAEQYLDKMLLKYEFTFFNKVIFSTSEDQVHSIDL